MRRCINSRICYYRISALEPSVGRKNLKQSRQSLNRQKRVSIVSNLKTPEYNKPSLIDRRKATPAKTAIKNHDESPSLTSLSNSHIKNSGEPLNVTLLSSKSTNSKVLKVFWQIL
jgi:hypothetical protein